ncbi:protein interacting with Ttk69 and Sin3A isoform X2 [Anticarsia gemmatalis]|uniref:protein interacting with Ttk69 and Sin3A isoform X2 n=1 Tax=Anticarsia gemmatalis TaxID=129554 RepID=UPI003F75A313
MDVFNRNRKNRYDRVMPRVNIPSRSSLKSSSFVTRHDIPSSVRVGAKPSASNDEIHAYHETEKLMRIRSSLYKKCGVVLDDVGNVAADKAVQVEDLPPRHEGTGQAEIRSERGHVREDAGATVSDQQMRSTNTRYPVDRYLVESSKKFEMVNIIDDELWNTEPALKPEDEIILRKLHEMLQSTADDLKLLSGELSKFHEPGVQVKTTPTPLDEEFNEKVHIEEIVNAKFHGYKIIDKPFSSVPEYKPRNDVTNVRPTVIDTQKPKVNNNNVEVNTAPILKKPSINKNLEITRTKVIQINGNQDSTKTEKLNNGKVVNAPAVAYNEYSYKYVEPKLKTPRKVLQVQEMPSINIRSELKEQKVLQLDIIPDTKESVKSDTISKNIAVVAVQHEDPTPIKQTITQIVTESQKPMQVHEVYKPAIRRISKMSACDSSGSTNNNSSDTQVKLKTQKRLLTNIRSPKNSSRSDRKRVTSKKDSDKRSHLNLDEWRKKLNVVYGPTSSKNNKLTKTKSKTKISPKKTNLKQSSSSKPNTLNNVEYIPYSKLTIGGARASDIEKEISDIPNKNNIPLSPILDKILSSRENSFSKNIPRKHKTSNSLKVLTTSDENLLQEVIDIERTISETISKNLISAPSDPKPEKISSDTDEAKENESYVDDFEDEKSDHSGQSGNQRMNSRHSSETNQTSDEDNKYSSDNNDDDDGDKNINDNADDKPIPSTSNTNIHNLTYTKKSNLSLKNKIDVFEFVHAVDTQESATQSNTVQKISPKETQTTPRSERNVQPIHNDLWPTMDPNGRVEKMFELEKEFIKKLIVEEYGDVLEKNITKPSTSKEVENKKNVAAFQKNTQTSPAHVKHVMTSPARTKTRTTSPFARLTVDHHTSPLIFVTDEDNVKIEIEEEEDLGISINLSSPRFSLRLPRNSREVISNMGDSLTRTERRSATESKRVVTEVKKINNNMTSTSTSSVEADSSELSSLGEVRLRKMFGKIRIPSDTESVSSTSSKYSSDFQSGILPLRSEGETSLGLNKKSNKYSKSEGEASFGML